MKIRPNLLRVALLSALFALFSLDAAPAYILLNIDDSNPSAIIITATGSIPSAKVGPSLIAEGIDLTAFFTGSVGLDPTVDYGVVTSSNLTAGVPNAGTYFTQATSDNLSGNDVDLNLYHNKSSDTLTFKMSPDGVAAFTGTLTLNLPAANLPSVGTTGNIKTGYSLSSTNTLIGQWEIISPVEAPEPSTWAFLLGSLGVLALLRRNLRRA